MQHRGAKWGGRDWNALIIAVIFAGSLFYGAPAFSQTSEYETIARNFLLFVKSDKKIVSTSIVQANDLDPGQPKVDIAFLAGLSQGGYILVSTSRRVKRGKQDHRESLG